MDRTSIPGLCMSQMTQVMPRCLLAPGSVRTSSSCQSETNAELVQIFWPVTTRSPESMTARVRSEARSDPAPGSENPWHQRASPRRIGGRWAAFCSGVAHWISVGPAWLSPTNVLSMLGSPACPYSSYQMSCSSSDSPRPPYSFGQEMPAQPPSYWARCHPVSYARMPAASDGRGPAGLWPASQVRTSSRKSRWSGEKSRSTVSGPPHGHSGKIIRQRGHVAQEPESVIQVRAAARAWQPLLDGPGDTPKRRARQAGRVRRGQRALAERQRVRDHVDALERAPLVRQRVHLVLVQRALAQLRVEVTVP